MHMTIKLQLNILIAYRTASLLTSHITDTLTSHLESRCKVQPSGPLGLPKPPAMIVSISVTYNKYATPEYALNCIENAIDEYKLLDFAYKTNSYYRLYTHSTFSKSP
jgi:hypothetical protein